MYSAILRPSFSSMMTKAFACMAASNKVSRSPLSSSKRAGSCISFSTGCTLSHGRLVRSGTKIRPPSRHSSATDGATSTSPKIEGKRCRRSTLQSEMNGVVFEITITAKPFHARNRRHCCRANEPPPDCMACNKKCTRGTPHQREAIPDDNLPSRNKVVADCNLIKSANLSASRCRPISISGGQSISIVCFIGNSSNKTACLSEHFCTYAAASTQPLPRLRDIYLQTAQHRRQSIQKQ